MPIFRLGHELAFPPPELAEDGLLAVGGDLSTKRLLLAYRSGIFPWYNAGEPILWWSPDPRMVIDPAGVHVSKRLRRRLRQHTFHLTADQAFAQVVEACAAAPRRGQLGTWITPEMCRAYVRLHEAGYAHSVEAWQDGALVGGLYGVSMGGAFFGESMFHRATDASKAAMAALCAHACATGIDVIDCQMSNPHLVRLGGYEMPRAAFLGRLRIALEQASQVGPWTLQGDPAAVSSSTAK